MAIYRYIEYIHTSPLILLYFHGVEQVKW